MAIFSAGHIIVLYLYQFQFFQESISPDDSLIRSDADLIYFILFSFEHDNKRKQSKKEGNQKPKQNKTHIPKIPTDFSFKSLLCEKGVGRSKTYWGLPPLSF